MQNKMSKNLLKQGFTLLEILMVLALLGIVIGIVAPKIFGGMSRGKVQAAKLQLKQIEGYLDRYRLDCNKYPTTADGGLQALVEKPGGSSCKNYDPSGYLGGKKSIPKDPWDNPIQYKSDDGVKYKLYSWGEDGVEGGDGNNADITADDE